MNKRQRKKAFKKQLAENFVLWLNPDTNEYARLTWRDVKVKIERRSKGRMAR